MAKDADVQLGFYSDGRVATLDLQGLGCSVCAGGIGDYSFEYDTSSNSDGYNDWKWKTTETLPDLSENVVYSNYLDETMMSVHIANPGASNEQRWFTYTRYDDDHGRAIMEASPSAFASSLTLDDIEANADLVGFSSGTSFEYISTSSGLVNWTDYYAETDSSAVVNVGSGLVDTSGRDARRRRGLCRRHEDFSGNVIDSDPRVVHEYFAVTDGTATVAMTADDSVYSTANDCSSSTDPARLPAASSRRAIATRSGAARSGCRERLKRFPP